jgi:hypothetical protein
VRVIRGDEPDWYQDAANMNEGDRNMSYAISSERMKRRKIHASETAWVGTKFDAIMDNNGTIDDLFEQVKGLVQDPLASSERPLYAGLADSLHTLS